MTCDFCAPLKGNHVLAAQCDLKCADPFGEKGLCDCYMSNGHGSPDLTAAEHRYEDDDAHEDWEETGEGGSTWLRQREAEREPIAIRRSTT